MFDTVFLKLKHPQLDKVWLMLFKLQLIHKTFAQS